MLSIILKVVVNANALYDVTGKSLAQAENLVSQSKCQIVEEEPVGFWCSMGPECAERWEMAASI